MKLEAKQRLRASWQADLGEVKSAKIQKIVNDLSKIVTIKHILTDGYNEDGAGCEVVFDGKHTGGVAYKPTLDAKSVAAIGKLMLSSKDMDVELLSNDDGDLTLIILGEAKE